MTLLHAPAWSSRSERRYASVLSTMPKLVPFVAPEALERERGSKFELRLGANENPWGCSPAVRAASVDLASVSSKYCDPESHDLRLLLAARHQCSVENLIVGEGIDGLLGLLVRAFTDPGDSLVMTEGSYATFAYHAAGFGAALQEVPYRNQAPDLERMLETAARTRAKLVYLANPDNPSGMLIGRADVERFAAAMPAPSVLILDEAYADFVDPALLANLDVEAPVVRLRTFSKAHGLAGARLGYVLAPADVCGALAKIRLHFGVSLASQIMCALALQDSAHTRWVAEQTALGRADYARLAEQLGLQPLPSATNFVTINVGSEAASMRWVRELASAGVFVRRPGRGALRNCIRVSVGSVPERARLAELMQRVSMTIAEGTLHEQISEG